MFKSHNEFVCLRAFRRRRRCVSELYVWLTLNVFTETVYSEIPGQGVIKL